MNTNGIGNAYTAAAQSAAKAKETGKTTKTKQKEIGNPQLSEKAQKYYDKLKKKFSNMDFILVSADKKEEAEANAGQYASNKELIVLIDEEKIEKMAEDEAYREKYEGILGNATAQLAEMKKNLGSDADVIKSFGMKFDDKGNASYFAVVDKALVAQKQRIEKQAAQKLEDKKQAEKQERKDRAEKKREDGMKSNGKDTVTVEASSFAELQKKIKDAIAGIWGDSLRTEEETWVGQKFDYTI